MKSALFVLLVGSSVFIKAEQPITNDNQHNANATQKSEKIKHLISLFTQLIHENNEMKIEINKLNERIESLMAEISSLKNQ